VRLGGDGLWTWAVGSGKSGGSFGPALSAQTQAVGAFMTWAHGSAAPAKQRVVRHMAQGGDRAPTRGPQRGKEETNRWDPMAEIFSK
jgi:hypothetical protein